MIRIVLGHRSTLVRGALAAVLSREPGLTVVAELARDEEVLTVVVRERPHVVVLDALPPGTVALGELCHELCRRVPRMRVLVMLDHGAARVGRSLVRLAPRVGFFATDASPDDLVAAVRRLAHGEPVLDPELAVAALNASDNPLTVRECEVLRLAMRGAPATEIAGSLRLSIGTVRNHLSRIVSKTGARTRIEAIRLAQEAGWI